MTCTTLPWRPKANPALTRLINEIVLEEESDVIEGVPTSHFEYYVKALFALPNPPAHVQAFLADLRAGASYDALIQKSYLPACVKPFLAFTKTCIETDILDVAAAFTFGREVIIPTMFSQFKFLSEKQHPALVNFSAYLERHIELDGEVHGKLALSLIESLCETTQDWQRIETAAQKAIQARIDLWDGIYNTLI